MSTQRPHCLPFSRVRCPDACPHSACRHRASAVRSSSFSFSFWPGAGTSPSTTARSNRTWTASSAGRRRARLASISACHLLPALLSRWRAAEAARVDASLPASAAAIECPRTYVCAPTRYSRPATCRVNARCCCRTGRRTRGRPSGGRWKSLRITYPTRAGALSGSDPRPFISLTS